MSTMLSRSGRSNPDGGKLTQRFDIPVTEDLHEIAIITASHKGIPKAELLRGILEEALTHGFFCLLDDEARRALDVLCALLQKQPGEFLPDFVSNALKERLAMHRMVAQKHDQKPLDQYPIKWGRE